MAKRRKVKKIIQQLETRGVSTKSLVKRALIEKYGTSCWLCGKNVGYKITLHHVKPKAYGGDDSYENSSLVCEYCHQHVINQLTYGTEEYERLMKKLLKRRK